MSSVVTRVFELPFAGARVAVASRVGALVGVLVDRRLNAVDIDRRAEFVRVDRRVDCPVVRRRFQRSPDDNVSSQCRSAGGDRPGTPYRLYPNVADFLPIV
ncbi:hypothetical protein C476_14658 [Natrinema limicola JCM 13563]|uniref:Uncharacterized protein n=1 Tax=Natrinema limicola JCM 13563 TaxID=1230457 RepID=M0C5R7_9EURY|nr:hypothetical protein C476_14658 [Natrinema limicola JCM 13563]